MSIWEPRELGSVGVAVLDCVHSTPSDAGVGYPYIAIPNIRDQRVDLTGVRRITENDYVEWTRRTKPQVGDVVVTRRGRVGDTAVIPDGMQCAIGQNLVLLRSDGSEVDQEFLGWACRSPYWWAEVGRLLNVGAVFSSLNVRDISRVRLPMPPLPQQRQIAAVLGIFEELIATNRRLIQDLDALAQALFTKSAGHESGNEVTFDDVADIGGGGTPSTKEPGFWGGSIPWATPTDMTALRSPFLFSTARTLSAEGLASCASALYPAGSILMTSRATIGAFALAQVATAVNQGFIVVTPRQDHDRAYLFMEMRRRVPEFVSRANGSTFLELSRRTFKALSLWWPTEAVRKKISDQIAPLVDQAAALEEEIRDLTQVRDELMPLLMSGRVSVQGFEAVA